MSAIIFLDIDGVMNSSGYKRGMMWGSWGNTSAAYLLDSTRVERLNQLVHATQATVILSSGWRTMRGLQATQKALDSNGAEFTLAGETEVLPSGNRAQEIRDFMTDIRAAFRFEGKYVILDDMRPAGEGHGDAFVHVPDGLEDLHVTQALRVLGVAT